MRIAQIAPLYERVPPRLYGGTERIVSYLTEELVRQGHDVTLFASGDSKTSAKLVRCCDMALRLNPTVQDPLPYHVIMLEEIRLRSDDFDVLHFHIDLLHAPLARIWNTRALTTQHGRLDLPDLVPFYAIFRDLPWSPCQTISADICAMRIGWAQCTTVFRVTRFRSIRTERVVISSRPHFTRKRPQPRD
jgi:hypothetical protein